MIERSIWGPSTWLYLHTLTLSYPDNPTNNDKYRFYNFFKNIILPCETCEKDFKMLIKQYPIEDNLSSKKDIVNWLINIHNIINRKLDKYDNYNYKDMVKFIKNGVNSNNSNIYNSIITFIIIFIILCIFYKIFFLLYK